MSELFLSCLLLCFPPFVCYLPQLIFMGIVTPTRLRRWWQYLLVALAVCLFNLPKAIWGFYSVPADLFRLLAGPFQLAVIPILFFDGPVWKRLLTNLLLCGGQVVSDALAFFLIQNVDLIRVSNTAFSTFAQSAVYTAVGLLGIILVDSSVVIFARTLQARRFSGVYLPVMLILVSLALNYYAYFSAASVFFWCGCILLGASTIVFLLYYVVSLEKKAVLEEELRDTRHRMALEQVHYKAVEERREELAQIRHDFNNQLSAISQLIRTGEDDDAQTMIQQLGEDIAATRENPYCAIPVVNAVLTEKEKQCRERGILLQTELDIPTNLLIEPLHLCSVLSNLLDNAINGCAGTEQPMITLASAMAGDYLFLRTVNPARPPQKLAAGHGQGSRILTRLAEQYHGSYETSYENGVFTAVVSLLPEEQNT